MADDIAGIGTFQEQAKNTSVPILLVQHLEAGYPGRDVIRDVSLKVQPGEMLAIIGPNGCGKSTLLKAIAGLIPARPDAVKILGKPLTSWTHAELAKVVGLLPQSRDIPQLDVEMLVAHGRFPHSGFLRRLTAHDHKIIANAMATLAIEPLRYISLRELSGGERQKAYLAMLLAQDAQLFLLDEPTTFLDAGFQLEILECLHELNRMGKTIIMVLHDLNHALSRANRICLMADGQLLMDATPSELIASQLIDRIFNVAMKEITADGHTYYHIQSPSR